MRSTAALISASWLAGCSLFGPRLQTVTIYSDPSEAEVIINGERAGKTPLRQQVRRSEDLLIELRRPGYANSFRNAHRTLSTLGIMDVIGGSILLVPFFGLLSAAAWKHEPSTFAVTLEPADDGARMPSGQRVETNGLTRRTVERAASRASTASSRE